MTDLNSVVAQCMPWSLLVADESSCCSKDEEVAVLLGSAGV